MIKDIKAQNENVKPTDGILAKLHADFPQCFNNEGKFDLEKFRQLIEPETDITKEGYGLDYLGKNYANLICCTESETVIQPDLEHNAKPENAESQNIYISGDNLDALKHLLKSYAGKIKCIYIDPPYNTGSDGFVYNDNFKFTTKDLQTKLGISEEKAKRILDLCTRGSSSHSAWLMFMAPRLMLASNLLKEDGVIFISIDDNEQANLKLLCDSIFGEENLLCTFPRVTKKGGKSSSEVARNHDYVEIYTKNYQCADLIGIEHNDKGYSNKDAYFEERGFYKINQTLDYDSLGYVNSLDYPIEIDGITYYAGGSIENYKKRQNGNHGRADWCWRWSKELFDFGYNNGFIEVKNGGARPRIYTKTYQNVTIKRNGQSYEIVQSERTKPLSTLEFTENIYSNDNAKKGLDDIMEKGVFEYTKPPALIQKLTSLVNDDNIIILDFFSGSATTAHAVMKLNSEDGGNRKFIMVQLPEKTPKDSEANKAGYDTIDQIGQERIRRAAAKIKNDLQSSIDLNTAKLSEKEKKLETEVQQQKLFAEGENPLVKEIETIKAEIENQQQILDNADFGFRHYTLQNVDQNTLDKMETFDPQWFEEPDILEQFGKETVLATWLLHDGYGFGEAKPLKISEYTAYHCGSHLYFIEGDNFDENAVTALIDKYNGVPDFNPQNIVLFGYSFSFTQTEMLKKNLNTLQNSAKELKFNIDIRY